MVCCPHLSPNILTDKMASESVPEFQDEQTALIERDPEQDEQQECGAVAKQSESKLTLYHWTQSFNSQKVRLLGHTWVEEGNKEGYEDLNVLFYAKLVDVKVAVIVRLAIAEKGLRCDMYDVSLPLSEHNEPWFMHLNPTGEVPVLVHDENIICDPIQIMDYLEQHFNDGTPKLIPEEGSTYYHRVQHYRELLDSLQMDAYTHGCILHPEITVDSHIPAYAATCIRTQIGNTQSELKKLAEQNPELKDAYIAKQRRLKSKLFDHDNMKYLKKLLDELESVMDQVETELQRRVEETPEEGNQSWLCGDFFSMADVSLAVTLHRLKFLGLSRRFWGNGNRVNLETYYERVVERPAFRRVLGHVNNILISAVLPVAFRVARKNAPAILGTTLLIGVLGGATYLAFLYMKKRLTLSI